MVGMFALIICSFDLISVCWKDYPKGDLIRFEKRTIQMCYMTCQSDLIWTHMNFKYSLYIMAFADSSHLLLKTPAVWILGFVPQNFISKNNL